jgi:hypothetical protein
MMTGNEDLLLPETKASKVYPSGRITIVDELFDGGKPQGVKGVRVSCNSFIKFAHSYTDEDGYYKMNKKYSAKPRYRLVFDNVKDFSIGFNLILVPASTSTLGKASPSGINMTVTRRSESKLFKRCVVNNAAYDYYTRCSSDDLNIVPPPKDLRIWLFHNLKASSSMMMHHGAIIDMSVLSSFLGSFAPLIKIFLPDITIGVKGHDDYQSIYAEVCHELAHASHFSKVGTEYWNRYILYVLGSYVSSGGMTYGDGRGTNSGYCEVGEMWAYYMSAKLWHERYGGNYPAFGTSYWFYPQILRYIEAKGIRCRGIFECMDRSVNSRDMFQRALMTSFPDQDEYIDIVPGSVYGMSLDYEFIAPLSFGPDFRLQITEDIHNLNVDIQEVTVSKVIVKLDAVNAVPLAFMLEAQAIDAEGNVIESISAAIDKTIVAGTLDSPSVNPVQITFTAQGKLSFEGIRLTVTADSPAEAPLNDNQYFMFDNISLHLPEGITYHN